MDSVRSNPGSWRFDGVIVDGSSFRITVDGEPRAIEPKSFRLLQFLIDNRDRAVSKEEILQAVWAGAFVTDSALTRAVAQIRKVIGDDPRQPRYIETIPTIGYRFLAKVDEWSEPEPTRTPTAAAPPPPRTAFRHPGVLFVVAAVVLAAAALGVWYWPDETAVSGPPVFLPMQFSSSPGLDVGASFSPDGSLVAYSSDRG